MKIDMFRRCYTSDPADSQTYVNLLDNVQYVTIVQIVDRPSIVTRWGFNFNLN